MDIERFNLHEDWNSIESAICSIWPKEWIQLNPLEIKALEEIIEGGFSLDEEFTEVPGGMACDFSVDMEKIYYILAAFWYLKDLTEMTNEDIKRNVKSFIETCNNEMKYVYKEIIEPNLDKIIFLLRGKR